MLRLVAFIVFSAILVLSNVVKAAEPRNQRIEFLIACLDRRIPEMAKGETAMPEYLDQISRQGSAPGFEKDPTKRLPLIVDETGFRRETQDMFDSERVSIKLDAKQTNVRVETALNVLCNQIEGVFLIRSEYIEIVPRAKACKELKVKLAPDDPMPQLVHRIFSKVPLETALRTLSERYNRNIVLAPEAEAKFGMPVTARFVNVPLNAAVETLADMAELAVVRKRNLLYVTTKEQAAELRVEEAPRANVEKKLPPNATPGSAEEGPKKAP